jgi:hypothetical protein
MRTAGLAVACLILVGCGGSSVEAKMKTACMKEDGMTEAQCSCLADRAGKDLSTDAQQLMIAEMEKDQARVQELSQKMSMQDAASVGTFLMNAMAQCAVNPQAN